MTEADKAALVEAQEQISAYEARLLGEGYDCEAGDGLAALHEMICDLQAAEDNVRVLREALKYAVDNARHMLITNPPTPIWLEIAEKALEATAPKETNK